MSKTSIAPDQQQRVQAVAAKLAQGERDRKEAEQLAQRRARLDDATSTKTNSVLTLQPNLLSDAGPAMKWDKKFGDGAKDKSALRAQYLGDVTAGRGSKDNLLTTANGRTSPLPPSISNRDLPALPKSELDTPKAHRGASRSPAPNDHAVTPEASVTPVPWPNDSPTGTPLPDDKPFPTVSSIDHPATRSPVPERKPVQAPQSQVVPQTNVRANEDQGQAFEKKQSPNKLKKKEGGGFRKLFGRKKTNVPAATTAQQPRESEDYPTQAYAQEPARNESVVEDYQPPVRDPSPAYSAEKSEQLRAPPVPYEKSPAVSSTALADSGRHSPPVAPGSNAHEQQQADQAFSRFDQGPMEDMPAFAPQDDSDDDAAAAPNVARRPVPAYDGPPSPVTPTPYASHPRDDISEESVTLKTEAIPTNDRWAQIRKNAAERAQRLSEEQSRRSRSQSQSQRTDEGETSGEETIESRVARIKARVAELTGNMDGQPSNYSAGPAR